MRATRAARSRRGVVLVFVLVCLVTLFGIAGLVVDLGALTAAERHAQHMADAAATKAATELRLKRSHSAIVAAANDSVHLENLAATATVIVRTPPTTGPYIGSSKHVEVVVSVTTKLRFLWLLGSTSPATVAARAVAGIENSTAGAAVVVLDPDPAPLSLAPLPLSIGISLPSLLGGLEVLGLANVDVDGAVLVNTRWGHYDEDWHPAGVAHGPPYGVSCTPILALTRLTCRDLRVCGGVDSPLNYRNFVSGKPSPIKANAVPVPDPLADLPVPTTAVDSTNVKSTYYGGMAVVGPVLPILPAVQLNPGVYDWITIVAGRVRFNPGVYIIRGRHPVTNQSLNIVAGQVEANGVMFYMTSSGSYSATSGSPDASDSTAEPSGPLLGTVVPSAIVNIGLTGSSFTPLNSPGSPFHGMMFYQRRNDRRPILIIQENLIGAGTLRGTIYAKWGHVILAGKGTYQARICAGTVRLIALLEMRITPTQLFPPAEDVYLVE